MNEALWRRVENALDARRDPLEDESLALDLATEPGALESVQRLMARLDALQDGAGARSRRALPTLVRLGLAAALVACLGALLWRRDSTPARPLTLASGDKATVSLVVERLTPPPARGRRVVLEPRHVLQWTLEGSPE